MTTYLMGHSIAEERIKATMNNTQSSNTMEWCRPRTSQARPHNPPMGASRHRHASGETVDPYAAFREHHPRGMSVSGMTPGMIPESTPGMSQSILPPHSPDMNPSMEAPKPIKVKKPKNQQVLPPEVSKQAKDIQDIASLYNKPEGKTWAEHAMDTVTNVSPNAAVNKVIGVKPKDNRNWFERQYDRAKNWLSNNPAASVLAPLVATGGAMALKHFTGRTPLQNMHNIASNSTTPGNWGPSTAPSMSGIPGYGSHAHGGKIASPRRMRMKQSHHHQY